MLPKPDVIQILSHATVFVCPSVYEPMGIVNLEAMACEAAGRRDRGRRHPRGGRGRRHRAARPLRGAAGRNGNAGRPGRPRRRARGAGQRAPRRPGARRGDGPAPAGHGRSSASAGTSPRRRRSRCTSGCSTVSGSAGPMERRLSLLLLLVAASQRMRQLVDRARRRASRPPTRAASLIGVRGPVRLTEVAPSSDAVTTGRMRSRLEVSGASSGCRSRGRALVRLPAQRDR